jgi:hypothetical protein
MFCTEIWHAVPDGATLHVAITSSGAFALSGTHRITRGPGQPVLKGDLDSSHFPLDFSIRAGEAHIVNFDAGFIGQPCKLRVDAEVRLAGGSVHQKPFTCEQELTSDSPLLTVKLFTVG